MVEAQCSVQLAFPVDLALEEILYLQDQGPLDQDVSTVLEIEQRAHENGLQVGLLLYSKSVSSYHYSINTLAPFQENYYWLDRILRSYQSRAYFGDVSDSFKVDNVF
ncbi:hypothetical protein BHE74_00007008 [Ensete ventricosum]|nr:hypothetical protein GW17_00026523 [Ensete ventricosum]RWW84384.1 hypothetical protein BHE74_00007008 [Ensete ventricosum]RZR85651.1 hypothetical protein BHM03_00012669 [Ensete ventricosum]